MPMADPPHPGVYVQELPAAPPPIEGVDTATTAFVDAFPRGPLDRAARITSFADFTRQFGGLGANSEASYAIQQFFLNGGANAWVVRVAGGTPAAATRALRGGTPAATTLTVSAIDPGSWGDNLQIAATAGATADRFTLQVREVQRTGATVQPVRIESFRNLAMSPSDRQYAVTVVNQGSALVQLADAGAGIVPATVAADGRGDPPAAAWQDLTGGTDGAALDADTLIGDATNATGMHALDRIAPGIFNLLCIPAAATLPDAAAAQVIAAAAAYCADRCAFLLVDPPAGLTTANAMVAWMSGNGAIRSANAAIYFPRLTVPDPLANGAPRNVGAGGTMAGVYARIDAASGVWKAPAGVDATLRGASLAANLTDLDSGGLTQIGVNALRNLPPHGPLSWGARTLDGADQAASQWKYVPVRRTASFIEASLRRGLQWAVFEPDGEPLWARIRLASGAFMNILFRQGAFQGARPDQAYVVKCDGQTTTQADIGQGVVNVLIGFAPLKPAEFVMIEIRQPAGQTKS